MRPTILGVLRDATPVALVAIVTFLALRRWVCDRYPVPSGSMQPTIYGDEQRGDIVVVDKLASVRSLQRYDLVVMRKVDTPDEQVIKRVVAFGDDPARCWIDIRDGDLWLGPDRQRLQRDVKDPLAMRDLRVRWAQWPMPQPDDELPHYLRLDGATVGERIDVPAREGGVESVRAATGDRQRRDRLARPDGPLMPSGFVGTARAVDSGYLDAYDHHGHGGTLLIDDCGLDLEADVTGDLFCCLELRPDCWTFHWRPGDDRVSLWRNGETMAELPASGAGPRRAGPAHRIEYGLLDGRFFFAVDDGVTARCSVDRRPEWLRPDPGPQARAMPRNLLYVGSAAPLRIRRLLVFRDLHYYRDRLPGGGDEWPRLVPEGSVFLLGDNSSNSTDSRNYGPVPCTAFLGRPRWVLGPWPRVVELAR